MEYRSSSAPSRVAWAKRRIRSCITAESLDICSGIQSPSAPKTPQRVGRDRPRDPRQQPHGTNGTPRTRGVVEPLEAWRWFDRRRNQSQPYLQGDDVGLFRMRGRAPGRKGGSVRFGAETTRDNVRPRAELARMVDIERADRVHPWRVRAGLRISQRDRLRAGAEASPRCRDEGEPSRV